jgi:pimeloyl-CoA synthetase
MKRFALILTILAASSALANAQPATVTFGQIANELRSNDDSDFVNGLLTGLTIGYMQADDVCSGNVVAGAAEMQLAAEIDHYVDGHTNKQIKLDELPGFIHTMLKAEYPCKDGR